MWHAFRFTTTSSAIVVEYGIAGDGEMLSLLMQLYDGDGNRLRGRTEFLAAGNAIDGEVVVASMHAATDAVDGPLIRIGNTENGVIFLCNAACNPSREFVLVVAGAGDLLERYTTWLSVTSPTWLGNTTGTDVGVISSRSFQSTLSASAVGLGQGVSVVQAGVWPIQADDRLVATYLKTGARPLQRMSVEKPLGSPLSCPCNVTEPAGSYRFRLDDVDAGGDEAYLAWADVRFP